MHTKWFTLGWVPGQTHPGPKGEVKINLLLSSLPAGGLQGREWMLQSYVSQPSLHLRSSELTQSALSAGLCGPAGDNLDCQKTHGRRVGIR